MGERGGSPLLDEVNGLKELHQSVLGQALEGDFKGAITNFGPLISAAERMELRIEDGDPAWIPSVTLHAGLYRDRGFTGLRQILHDSNTDSRTFEHAEQWLFDASEVTAHLVGGHSEMNADEHRQVLAAHGKTLTCLGRMSAAHEVLTSEMSWQGVDHRIWFDQAHNLLTGSRSAYGLASNAMHAARQEVVRGNSLRTAVTARWLGRAGAVLAGAYGSEDAADRKAARLTVANHSRALVSRRAAIRRTAGWRTV